MNDVTRILSAIERGDPQAAERLLPLVYDELRRLADRKLAREEPGQTLQATALVHEAYLRLVDPGGERPWEDRVHFLAAAVEAMRRILIDRARDRKRLKRGGGRRRRELDLESLLEADAPADDLLDLDEAIDRLAGDRRAGGGAGEAPPVRRPDGRAGGRGPGGRPPHRRARLDLRPHLALRPARPARRAGLSPRSENLRNLWRAPGPGRSMME